jgi:hypothetical protein
MRRHRFADFLKCTHTIAMPSRGADAIGNIESINRSKPYFDADRRTEEELSIVLRISGLARRVAQRSPTGDFD